MAAARHCGCRGPLKCVLGLSVAPEEILLALSATISELDVKDQSDTEPAGVFQPRWD